MKAIIPVAGLGSRLRPHTYAIPKALLPVAGKPILGHIIDQVLDWGANSFCFIVGHLGDQIKDYVKDHYSVKSEFRVQKEILGLGHAVLTGLDPEDEDVLIILGDTILDTDLNPVLKRGMTSIGVQTVEDPRRFGVVVKKGKKVIRLVEKPAVPPSKLAIVGIYYIRDGKLLGKAIQELIDQKITLKGEYQLTDALQKLIEWGEVVETFPVSGWYDCGKPETVLATNRYLLDKNGGECNAVIDAASVIIPPVAIAPDAVITRSIVGPYAVVGAKSSLIDVVIKDSIIGDGCTIERTVLSESLISNRVKVRGRFLHLNLGSANEIDL